MSELLTRAITIARKAHERQVDRTGLPYVGHVMRVMSDGKNETEMIVGALHDLIEDTSWTIDELRAEGFPEEILAAVDALTHREDESYEAYIDRISGDPLAVQVKLYDLTDNMDVRRLERIGKQELELLKRYLKAWRKLTGQTGRKQISQERDQFLENVRKKHPNAFKPWTAEDDDRLERLFCERRTVSEIAGIFGRAEGGITARIEKLELEEKYG